MCDVDGIHSSKYATCRGHLFGEYIWIDYYAGEFTVI